jgi:predicted MFS family arabinose efflux permease
VSEVETAARGAAAGPESPKSAERTVQGHDFAWLWRAYTVSIFGDQLTLIALPIAAFARTNSALAVGLVASMEGATTVVFGLVAGAIADRLRHRPVLIVTDLARCAVLGALALVVAGRADYPVASLYVAAFFLGALRILHDGAAGSALPMIVNGRDLLRANGRLNASEAVGNAGGPALAGALTSISIGLTFAADALSFALSAFGVSRIRQFRDAPRRERSEESISSDIREGLRAVRSDRWVVRAMLLIAAMNVMAVAGEAQFVPYARTVLHVDAIAIGLYFAIAGVAGIITAFVLGRSDATRGDAMILGVAMFALGILLAGVFPGRVMAAIMYVLAGSGAVLAVSHWGSLRQRQFPVRILGRVTVATRMVLFGVMPVAALAGGALASAAGSATLFIAAGCVGLAACLWAWAVGLGSLRVNDVIIDQ